MTQAGDTPEPGGAGGCPAFTLCLRPSAHLTLVLTAIHAGALLCLLSIAPAPIVRGLLAALVCASAYRTLRRDARLSSPDAVLGLTRRPYGEWHLTLRSGEVLYARPGPDSYAHPQVVFLNFRSSREGRRTVVLLPDMVAPPSALRRLRRYLRTTW